MMRRATVVSLLLAFGGTFADTQQEFGQRWFELSNQSGDTRMMASDFLLDGFFGYEPPDLETTPQGASLSPGIASRGFMFPDVSDGGMDILRAARDAERDAILHDLGVRAELLLEHCDAGLSDAYAIASALAEIETKMKRRKLDRYTEAFGKLSDADQAKVRTFNLESHEIAYPELRDDAGNIQLSLATEFPDYYLERFTGQCEVLQDHRGLPFRRVVVETGPGCGPPKQEGSSELEGSGCTTYMEYTQEPDGSQDGSPEHE